MVVHQGGSEDADKLHFAKQSLSEIGRLHTRLIVMALTDQVAGAHPRRLERPHDPPPFAPTPALLDIPRTHRSVRRPSRGRASPTHSHSRPRRFLAPDEASPVATDCLHLGCSCSSGCNTNPWVHVRLPGSVVFRSPMRRGFALTPIVTLPLSPYGALHPPYTLRHLPIHRGRMSIYLTFSPYRQDFSTT